MADEPEVRRAEKEVRRFFEEVICLRVTSCSCWLYLIKRVETMGNRIGSPEQSGEHVGDAAFTVGAAQKDEKESLILACIRMEHEESDRECQTNYGRHVALSTFETLKGLERHIGRTIFLVAGRFMDISAWSRILDIAVHSTRCGGWSA